MNHIILPRDETLFLEFTEQWEPIVYECFLQNIPLITHKLDRILGETST